jgi:hypothetical protein
MKRVSLFLGSVALVASTLVAADYSSMSTDELMGLKGSVAPEDRAAFQAEMKSRVSSMSPEERASYGIGNNGQGLGAGNGAKLMDGSGAGSMNQGMHKGGLGSSSGGGLGNGGGKGGGNGGGGGGGNR